MTNHLANMTDEERAENLAKARQARIEKQEWAKKNLRQHWDSDGHWTELASSLGVRLPSRNDKAGSKYIQRIVKQFNLPTDFYESHSGFSNGNKEALANPTMGARAQVGFFLECVEEYLNENQ